MYCLETSEDFSNYFKLNNGGKIYETYKNVMNLFCRIM